MRPGILNRLCAAALGVSVLASAAPAADTSRAAGPHMMVLPHFEPELPAAPGRDEFMMACLSCHSARYVTMQPLFSEQKWAETVDKMAKVYGAQMDAAQRQAIIGYVVAFNQRVAGLGAASDGDDQPETSATVPSYEETTPALPLAAAAPGQAAEIQRGAALFQNNCAACHGPTGRGDGWVAPALWRQPDDLAATRYSRPWLARVFWNGRRGTAMPSWRGLSPSDLAALASYVQTLHPPTTPEQPSAASLERGRQLFVQDCATCHGVAGDGLGPAAANHFPQPANFKLKQPDTALILKVLRDGIPGTAMPSWPQQLSAADRSVVAGYVRSLFDPPVGDPTR